jgi:hypothetical protein
MRAEYSFIQSMLLDSRILPQNKKAVIMKNMVTAPCPNWVYSLDGGTTQLLLFL